MQFSFRRAAAALAVTALCAGTTAARAGDDGAAPLWDGIGSIFTPLLGVSDIQGLLGLGQKEDKPQIQYREHGKLVVPKELDLPAPEAGAKVTAEAGDWPVDQEIQRRKARKAAEAKRAALANQGDVRVRASQGFANTPVTVRAADEEGPLPGACPDDKCRSTGSAVLSAINPLGWVGSLTGGNKSPAPGPEPDREWLTDPPKGYRAAAGQAVN